MANAIIPLANITLSGSQANVTFSSISQSYRDLMLVIAGNSSGGSPSIQFNGDTGNNYNHVFMAGNGSSASSGGGSGQTAIYVNNWGFNDGLIKIDFFDYSSTDKHKTLISRSAVASTGADSWSGRWANITAINSIKIIGGANFSSGTSFALYGVSA